MAGQTCGPSPQVYTHPFGRNHRGHVEKASGFEPIHRAIPESAKQQMLCSLPPWDDESPCM